jgi:hypothetical protein
MGGLSDHHWVSHTSRHLETHVPVSRPTPRRRNRNDMLRDAQQWRLAHVPGPKARRGPHVASALWRRWPCYGWLVPNEQPSELRSVFSTYGAVMLPGPKSNVLLRRRRLRQRRSHVVAVVMTGALVLGLATPVSATTPTNTTTAAVVPQSPVNYATVVNFVAEVTSGLGLKRAGNPTVGIPGGTLTFSVGALKLCSATLVPSHSGPVGHLLDFGEAACSSTKAPVGDDAVTASYAGNSTYSPSSATARLVVDSRRTTTTVTVSPAVAAVGTEVTYHATVTGAGSEPTGRLPSRSPGRAGTPPAPSARQPSSAAML